MARRTRPDWEGALHHVMARGIDGRAVFGDERDRSDLLQRLSILVPEQELRVFAWAIMPNHLHLLTMTGPAPLSHFMHRLLTGYAVKHNLIRDRKGHVFQGRFKSIIVQEENYFKRLVRYIHRNPLEAGLVRCVDELEYYCWCGHGAITESREVSWQDTEYVLTHFDEDRGSALIRYMDFVSSAGQQDDTELATGTYLLGKDGIRRPWRAAVHADWSSCCRVLGDREFAQNVYARLRGSDSLRLRDRGRVHEDIEKAFLWIEDTYGFSRAAIEGNTRSPGLADARAMLARVLSEWLGLSHTEISKLLKMTRSGIRSALRRVENSELYCPIKH